MEGNNSCNPVCEVSLSVIPQSVLENMSARLTIIETLLQQRNESSNDQWIESTQARKMLCVSQKTWQNYRNERRIPFYQFGRKIYVKRSDLDSFMESHRIESRN